MWRAQQQVGYEEDLATFSNLHIEHPIIYLGEVLDAIVKSSKDYLQVFEQMDVQAAWAFQSIKELPRCDC